MLTRDTPDSRGHTQGTTHALALQGLLAHVQPFLLLCLQVVSQLVARLDLHASCLVNRADLWQYQDRAAGQKRRTRKAWSKGAQVHLLELAGLAQPAQHRRALSSTAWCSRQRLTADCLAGCCVRWRAGRERHVRAVLEAKKASCWESSRRQWMATSRQQLIGQCRLRSGARRFSCMLRVFA